jgi:hypothetical protein
LAVTNFNLDGALDPTAKHRVQHRLSTDAPPSPTVTPRDLRRRRRPRELDDDALEDEEDAMMMAGLGAGDEEQHEPLGGAMGGHEDNKSQAHVAGGKTSIYKGEGRRPRGLLFADKVAGCPCPCSRQA